MQPSNSFLLPKLRLVEASKTKTKSSYSNVMEGGPKLTEDGLKKEKKACEMSSEEIKQSRSKSTNSALSQVKFQYKYVNKSPEYFKKKERSLHTLDPPLAEDTIPMERIIDQKIKRFNKDSLIDLARSGLYKNINYRHRIIPRKKLPHPLYCEDGNKNVSSQTKYSSFNPTKIIPLAHSLQKVFPSTLISR